MILVNMTELEFDLIAKLIRSREPVKSAAKLVLVTGLTAPDAARQVGVAYKSCANTVTRFRTTHKEIVKIFGRKSKSA
jgi:transposase